MQPLTLYGYVPSPNTWKVLALAHHIGVPLTYREIDITKGEQHAPEITEFSPTGRMPVLVEADFVLTESNAILQYIAGLVPNTAFPADPKQRARMLAWQCNQMEHWGKQATEPLIFENMLAAMFGRGEPNAAIVERATAAFHREAKLIEAALAESDYLVGAEPTLADFAMASPMVYAKEAGFPLEPYPRLRAWSTRVWALPCWQAVAPKR